MKLHLFRHSKLALISLFFVFPSLSVNAISVENPNNTSVSSKTFQRDLQQVDTTTIDYELLKASFIDLAIKSYIEGCFKKNSDISLRIAATGEALFKEHPEWTKNLQETKALWEDVNTLTDEAGALSNQEIETLNMIAGARKLLDNNFEITTLKCSGFLRNLEDVPNREIYWDNYLKQAIPIIVTYS